MSELTGEVVTAQISYEQNSVEVFMIKTWKTPALT